MGNLPHGRGLESLVLASQYGVLLTRVPSAARYLPGKGMVATKGPCDFFGLHLSTGRLIVLDAKESREKYRLDTSESHLPDHQLNELQRYGERGAVAGLLVEHVPALRLYWCAWSLLVPRRPSVPFAEMADAGRSNVVIQGPQWDRIVSVTDERPGAAGGDGGRPMYVCPTPGCGGWMREAKWSPPFWQCLGCSLKIQSKPDGTPAVPMHDRGPELRAKARAGTAPEGGTP